ncbi:MAG: wax ester/triacylglycerol synthase family O-acyltransferase [Mycobacterium sp.]
MKRLSGWDALMLYSETPNVHQHTLKVAVVDTAEFEGEPDFDTFREILRGRLRALEPLRYQLVDIPFHFHHPMWREDVEVDLDYHVRLVEVPAPGGRRELDDVIGEIASTPLDRSRPLWELYFAVGLAGGRVAVIGKVHHALADGVASANLMARGMEWPGAEQEQGDRPTAGAVPSNGELIRAAAYDHVRQLKTLPSLIRDSVTGVYRLRRRALQRGSSPPPTFINHKVSSTRTFASATLSLAEAKETSKSLGITLNDLVLATAAGGLRDLLLTYDGRTEEPIVASVPVATDTSPDRITGNALSTLLVTLPVHVDDPLERVRRTAEATSLAKEKHRLLGPRTVGSWLEYVPPGATIGTFRWMSKRRAPNQLLNLIVSNVPGPRQRGRIAGAVVTEIYSVGPIAAGAAVNITVWSYVEQLNISVLADDQTFKDPHEVTDAMIDAFAAIRKAAGFSGVSSDVGIAMPQATRV